MINKENSIINELEKCLTDSVDELEKTALENNELKEKLLGYNAYRKFTEKMASGVSIFVKSIKEAAPNSSESVEDMIKDPEGFFQKLAAEVKIAVSKIPESIGTISDYNDQKTVQDAFDMLVRDGYETVLMNENKLLNR